MPESAAEPRLIDPYSLVGAARDVLALADQLGTSVDVRLVCSAEGTVLAQSRTALAEAAVLTDETLQAVIVRHAEVLLGPHPHRAGTLAPEVAATGREWALAYTARLVTLGGVRLHLLEFTTVAAPAPPNTPSPLDLSALPELLPADVHQEKKRVSTVIAPDGTYRDLNNVAERLFNQPRERIIGRAVGQVMRMSATEMRSLNHALQNSLRGAEQHETWWYRGPQQAQPITADVTFRAVRYQGAVAVHTLTRLLTDPRDPVHAAHLRNAQLELATYLLSAANKFQQPDKLLEFVLHQLVAKTPLSSGALYIFDTEAHHLTQLAHLSGPNPPEAPLPAHLALQTDSATVACLTRRKMRVAGRVLTTEFALTGAKPELLAVLPVCSDDALHFVLVLTLHEGNTMQLAWVNGLLRLISDGLNSVVTRERLRTELAGAEQRYQQLFNASADGILITDGHRILEANQTAADLFGYSPADLLAVPSLEALLEEAPRSPAQRLAPPGWRALVGATRQRGVSHTLERRLRRTDGRLLEAELRLRPLQLSEGTYVQVLVRDVGERHDADEALLRAEVLRQTTRELRNLLGTLRLAYISFDTDATILSANDYFVALTGYAREELLGRNYFEVFVPDLTERARRLAYYFEEIVTKQQMESEYESTVHTKAGIRLIMRWNRLFERDQTGQIQATISVGRDVTAGVLALEDSQRNRARFQDIFDNAHDLIQHLSPENRFVSVNRAWHQVLGYTEADLPALTLTDVVHPYHLAKLLHQLRALYRGEESGQIETVLLTRAGRSVHLIGSVSAQWQDGQVVASRLILHDITERIQAERLQKAYYSIANLAISARDLDALYAAIHRELSRLLDTHNLFITLCDEARTQLTLAYATEPGLTGRNIGEARAFTRGATEYIIGKGVPMLLQRTDLDALTASGDLQMRVRMPEVLAGVPLMVGGRVIGALTVLDYTNPDTYKPADLDVLHFISSQVALAIDRKRNEVQLHRQNARLSAIFESGSHLMWSVSPQHRLTAYNRNFALAFFDDTTVGGAAEGTLPEPGPPLDVRIVLSQNTELWEREYAAAFAGELRQFEVSTKRPDGEEAWAEIYLNPIRLPDGTLEEVSGIAHDITEKKMAQLELARQEELFRGIFESFQDVYYRTDAQGHLVLLSPSVEANFGFCATDLIGRAGRGFFIDDATYRVFVDAVYREGHVRGFEAAFYDRNHQPHAVLINARQLLNVDGQPAGIEGLVMDISPLKQAQQALLLAKQEAELALHAKTQFLANMSHELRTPMNGIIGMIELLQHTVQTPVQISYVETLRRSSDALLAILNDILDLSKIQAGKLAVALAPVDLADVVGKVQALFANRATQKGLQFTADVALDVPRFVETDEIRLLQILSNLTANAIKFTNQGGVHLAVRLADQTSVEADPLELRFEVVDSGIGIAPADAERLFTDFTQLDTTSTKSFGGTGLGLSISRQLAELLGGQIGVAPNPTGGSVFWFTIWCRPADEVTGRLWAAEREESRARHARGRFRDAPLVLLVDDNTVNQTVSARLLEFLGCRVHVAPNGFEALRMLTVAAAPAYEVVLMDIQMPGLDGTETTRRLREHLAHEGRACPPVVAMTAYSMQGDAERFRADGFDDYVAKPVTSRALFAALCRLLPAWPVLTVEPPVAAIAVAPSELPALAPDPEVLAQLVEVGGPGFVRELFADFVAESAPLLTQAATELAAGNVAALVAPAHQLKGAGAQLGLTTLAELARRIEQHARQPTPTAMTVAADFEQLRALFTTFAESYLQFMPPAGD